MELSGYDGDATTQVEIPYNGGYERYSSQVEVKDGQLTIAFYCLGNTHTSMQIDNVELWKIDSTAPSETYAIQVADGQEATLSASAEAALGETVTVSRLPACGQKGPCMRSRRWMRTALHCKWWKLPGIRRIALSCPPKR